MVMVGYLSHLLYLYILICFVFHICHMCKLKIYIIIVVCSYLHHSLVACFNRKDTSLSVCQSVTLSVALFPISVLLSGCLIICCVCLFLLLCTLFLQMSVESVELYNGGCVREHTRNKQHKYGPASQWQSSFVISKRQ